MTLYEISENIVNATNDLQIDEETGEIVNIGVLDALEMEFDEKAENIACYIKNLQADATAIKAEEKTLSERRKVLENKADRLKHYLSDTMQILGRDKISSARAAISFRKSAAVVVDDDFIAWAQENGDEYLTYKEPTVNKTAIKKAIQNGETFEYARLEENQNLQIK